MADDGMGLAEAIEAVRLELRRAQDMGADRDASDVRFAVGTVEVELAVELTKSGGGQASINVLGVLVLGGKGDRAKGETHRVTVSLDPLGKDGRPFEVSASTSRRPDSQQTPERDDSD